MSRLQIPLRRRKTSRSIPWLRLRDRDHHTLQFLRQNNLAPEPRVLVHLPIPRILPQHVLLVVRRRRQLVQPLLGDVDLTLGRAGVDLLEPVRGRIYQALVGQRLQKGLAREPHHLLPVAVRVDRQQLHDSIGDLRRPGRRRDGGAVAGDHGARGEGERGCFGNLGGELLEREDPHFCFRGFGVELFRSDVNCSTGFDAVLQFSEYVMRTPNYERDSVLAPKIILFTKCPWNDTYNYYKLDSSSTW
ncbi:histone H2A 2 [Striga asiatica]|uniref:Histone H2A 2 n=1 Tax=Striga asiatica TaxID=4170 RepID=A0A5A7RJQ2_STRAF|nr:histone H2A 2 [Striga asiatica]